MLPALNEAEGVYYVTGHGETKDEATLLSPTSNGKLIVKGLEADSYTITETATEKGYTLLAEAITVEITAQPGGETCPTCGAALLTASAAVNGRSVEMTEDNGSVSAIVPLTVVNTKSFSLPKTGGTGSLLFYGLGILALLSAGALTVICLRKGRNA